jgi:hypothetical protein
VQCVDTIISLEQSANPDSAATECLVEFANDLKRRDKVLLLARGKVSMSELLLKLAKKQFQDKFLGVWRYCKQCS